MPHSVRLPLVLTRQLRTGLALLGLALAARAQEPAPRPNIVFIYADDLGIGDVSVYNPQSAWRTPRIDQMAAEGVRFTDAHSASSLCTPSRYALLTGRYAWRGRLKQGVLQGYDAPLIEPGRLTVPGFLRQQGYATAMFGKWHLGLDWARRGPRPEDVDFAQPFAGGPRAHGFDHFLGISASLDMPPYVWLRDDRATRVPTGRVEDSEPPRLWRAGPISDDFRMEDVQPRLIDETIAWLGAQAAADQRRPFFLYLALASPHTPILPTGAFAGKTGTTDYGDFVTQVDADVGRVLDALDRLGLGRDTLVIFTSDNGFAPATGVPEHERIGHDPSAGYRGFKSDLYEGGHRVPFIARWTGRLAAGRQSAALIGQHDLFATGAALVGLTPPETAAEDSVSFLPALLNPATAGRTTIVNHSAEGRFAIREGNWKLLLWPGSGGWSTPTPAPSRWLKVDATDLASLPPYQLFDLAADPAEQRNVAADHPEVVRRLGRQLRDDLLRGRSTPGPNEPVAIGDTWPQTRWLTEFALP